MKPNEIYRVMLLVVAMFFFVPLGFAQQNEGSQLVHNRIPSLVKSLALKPVSSMDTASQLNLAICLPLRNQQALASLLHNLYDPKSPQYHQWLSTSQFTLAFGPTEADYQAVVSFAKANGFAVTNTFSDRMLVNVKGSVQDIERTLNVNMLMYKHPTENREFYAPDAEPSINLSIPVLAIRGLDNYQIPHPADLKSITATESGSIGTGPNGTFIGNDFRAAYVPGVSLKGEGQKIGLLAFNTGYYPSDIFAYKQLASLPDVPIIPVLLDNFDGTPDRFEGCGEISTDIEMAISMAPNIDSVVVFEGSVSTDVLEAISLQTSIKQFSCSWGGWIDTAADPPYFARLASQGQSFFSPSGDYGAWWTDSQHNLSYPPMEDTLVTIVGGTVLSTATPGGAWSSEVAWNCSGGGISQGDGGTIVPSEVPLPSYQISVANSANGGSTAYRNGPDVAMGCTNIWQMYNNGLSRAAQGTSCSSPLWAGFMALINQQAASLGGKSLGCINYAIYPLGEGNAYTTAFHDIVSGNNNEWGSGYNAVAGYDLVTGWGSPTGQTLINFLSNPVWSGTKVLTSSYSVPSGQSLIIDPGTKVELAAGVSINVSGVLNAVGTSSQPITFTSTGSTSPGSWGPIVISGSGANGSTISYANIQYGTEVDVTNASNVRIQNCNITNNIGNGVSFSQGASGELANCTINGCSAGNGVVIQGNSTPTLLNNTISNSYYHGIISIGNTSYSQISNNILANNGIVGGVRTYCGIDLHSSIAEFDGNEIYGSNYGLYSENQSNGYSSRSPGTGLNNYIHDNNYGVFGYNYSTVSFGNASNSQVTGYNQFSSNVSFNVVGSSYSTLYAVDDWWGGAPSKIGAYTGSVVYYTPYLPWNTQGGEKNPEITVGQGAASQTSFSLADPFDLAENALANKEYDSAEVIYRGIINHPVESGDAERALEGLYDIFRMTKKHTLVDFASSIKDASDDKGLIASEMLMGMYAAEGNLSQSKQIALDLCAKHPGTEVEKRALIHLASLGGFAESERNQAKQYMDTLVSKFGASLDAGMLVALGAGENNGSGSVDATAKLANGDVLGNYPNPFNPTTTISYQIPTTGRVTIKVFDVLGRDVTTLVDDVKPAGKYSVRFDASRLSSGIYFYSIKSGNYNAVKKMLLLK